MRRADWVFFSEAARAVQTYRELIGIDAQPPNISPQRLLPLGRPIRSKSRELGIIRRVNMTYLWFVLITKRDGRRGMAGRRGGGGGWGRGPPARAGAYAREPPRDPKDDLYKNDYCLNEFR